MCRRSAPGTVYVRPFVLLLNGLIEAGGLVVRNRSWLARSLPAPRRLALARGSSMGLISVSSSSSCLTELPARGENELFASSVEFVVRGDACFQATEIAKGSEDLRFTSKSVPSTVTRAHASPLERDASAIRRSGIAPRCSRWDNPH